MEIEDGAIAKSIKNLILLKDSLIKIIGETEQKDLNKKFITLAGQDPDNMELFQTLMLMQDISSTSQKAFKEYMVNIINILINSKIDTLNMVSNVDLRLIKTEIAGNSELVVKIPVIGTVKKKDVLALFINLFVIIFVSYIINPEATATAIDGIKAISGVK